MNKDDLKRVRNIFNNYNDIKEELFMRMGKDSSIVSDFTWTIDNSDASHTHIFFPEMKVMQESMPWVQHIFWSMKKIFKTTHDAGLNIMNRDACVVIRIEYMEKSYFVTFDFSDYMDHINNEALDCSICYFKMQFDRDGYSDKRIVPGGYTNNSPHVYKYIPFLRSNVDKVNDKRDVYGRFGMRYASDIRKKAINILNMQMKFSYEVSATLIRHSASLIEASNSKICIDLPGNGDFCFRLVDYLSMGACVISYPHRTKMHEPLIHGKNIIYCEPDFSNLVDICQYYLNNDFERGVIQDNAREYFDSYLHRDQISRYYISSVLDIINK